MVQSLFGRNDPSSNSYPYFKNKVPWPEPARATSCISIKVYYPSFVLWGCQFDSGIQLHIVSNIKQLGAVLPQDLTWMVGKTVGVIDCVSVALLTLKESDLTETQKEQLNKAIENWKTGKNLQYIYKPTVDTMKYLAKNKKLA